MSVLRLPATKLIELFRAKKLSPVEVIQQLTIEFPRIDALTNAFLATDFDVALEQARHAEQLWMNGEPSGILCGIPISVKDSIEVQGMPTTYGSVAYRDNMKPDSLIAQRLRKHGAIIFGKTNLPEFALRPETFNLLRDPGRNPWNLERTCGGSSGGAAIAVATGLGPISIGTDSGGSIRGPSAQNGIFGIKPSYQRIPAVQMWRAAPGRSHNGPMTRTVGDALLTMKAIAGADSRDVDSGFVNDVGYWDKSSDIQELRVGVFGGDIEFAEGDDVVNALKDAYELLKKAGMKVDFVDAPPEYAPLRGRGDIWPYSGDHLAASINLLGPNFLQEHGTQLTDYAFKVYSDGEVLTAYEYRQALNHDTKYRQRMSEWLVEKSIDILIMQCVPAAPLIDKIGRVTDRNSNGLAMFNIARLPVAVVPFGLFRESAMPLGLQIVGRYGYDNHVLGVSEKIESEKMWINSWPQLSV
jgi:aspartyl-tRNA(Asn)/glutamyl-tRNA(Gln) amidotransferase subunit A